MGKFDCLKLFACRIGLSQFSVLSTCLLSRFPSGSSIITNLLGDFLAIFRSSEVCDPFKVTFFSNLDVVLKIMKTEKIGVVVFNGKNKK